MKYETMKRLAGMTTAAALALTPIASLAETAQSALVKGGALNLREQASLDAKVLGQYPTGTLVQITESGSEWHKVSVNGKTGYMMARYLSNATNETTATVRTNTGIGLNLREEPSLYGTILTSAKNGSEVKVLQRGTTWCRAVVDGKEGFMATQYLRFGASQSSSSWVGKTAVVRNPRDTQVLNLRETASLDARVLAYYRNGVKVTVLGEGGDWVKVQVEDGRIGYMMRKFLRVTNESATLKPYTAYAMNVNGGRYVNLRKGPSLSAGIISTVPVGNAVTVIEHGTDWCKVQVDGKEGYMSTWFLKR